MRHPPHSADPNSTPGRFNSSSIGLPAASDASRLAAISPQVPAIPEQLTSMVRTRNPGINSSSRGPATGPRSALTWHGTWCPTVASSRWKSVRNSPASCSLQSSAVSSTVFAATSFASGSSNRSR